MLSISKPGHIMPHIGSKTDETWIPEYHLDECCQGEWPEPVKIRNGPQLTETHGQK